MPRETVLILDFGAQYTQLIARSIREAGVYSEILPFSTSWKEITALNPKGIVLSGGPESVFAEGAPHPDDHLYDFPGPLLGICYGMQLLAHHFGGKVSPSPNREYGRTRLQQVDRSPLFQGLPEEMEVWMSHGDRIETVPPDFSPIARTTNALAAIAHEERNIYGLQFHPEVVHTPHGKEILRNFLFEICRCRGDWTMSSFVEDAVADISAQIGQEQAVCGLSGETSTDARTISSAV